MVEDAADGWVLNKTKYGRLFVGNGTGDVFTGQEKMIDLVNEPPHYTEGKIQCIDAIESAVMSLQGIEAFCTGNAIKYLWRWKKKNGVEDLKKARWYINRLIGEGE